MGYRIHIDTFSGELANLPAKLRDSKEAVLQLLSKHPRFSCFDASEYTKLAKTLDALKDGGYIAYKTNIQYPWCEVTLLDKADKLLASMTPTERGA